MGTTLIIFALTITIGTLISNSNPHLKEHIKIKHYAIGAFLSLIAIDLLTPPTETSLIIDSKTVNGWTLNYFIPYSGGIDATCPLISGYNFSKKIGASVLLKRTRIFRLCMLTDLPPDYVEPKFGDWKSIEM